MNLGKKRFSFPTPKPLKADVGTNERRSHSSSSRTETARQSLHKQIYSGFLIFCGIYWKLQAVRLKYVNSLTFLTNVFVLTDVVFLGHIHVSEGRRRAPQPETFLEQWNLPVSPMTQAAPNCGTHLSLGSRSAPNSEASCFSSWSF